MGFYSVIGAMLRRWYIPLLTVLLAGGAWVYLDKDGGCFTTSTVVTFTLPARATILPESGLEDSNVIAFAGLVASEINNGRPVLAYASRDAPLFGVGVRQGVIVGLPNYGGQWSNSYARAEIEIQIVGLTYEEVRERQTTLLDDVYRVTSEQQEANSSSEGRIRAAVLPMTGGIQEVVSSRSSRLIALIALLTSAVLLSGGCSVLIERRWSTKCVTETDGHYDLGET